MVPPVAGQTVYVVRWEADGGLCLCEVQVLSVTAKKVKVGFGEGSGWRDQFFLSEFWEAFSPTKAGALRRSRDEINEVLARAGARSERLDEAMRAMAS